MKGGGGENRTAWEDAPAQLLICLHFTVDAEKKALI
jgi:hypothetical protein